MPDRGGAADGQRRGRAVRSATAATIALGAALSGACASTVDGAGAPAPGEVAVYRSELSASAAAEVRAEGVELCRESMASMVVMVRGFNAFVARLNAAQTYAGVGDLDEKARASLIAGADGIRPKITETSPAAVSTPARAFLASTARLENAISRELRAGLNPVSSEWSRTKQRLLDVCGTYTPLPATSSATPRPSVPATTSAERPGG
ncbi:hypothetical protein [Gordonia hongkongensis]|uniref:Lipoprotein n=1 Tax=Gordonia hongkongensis TaxID=1701090 RepID=A0ABT6BW11_9ACTN|nr:hypothetical protein [Gordonia hongkongensis]MDF6101767.1 hypothetical protein [Gordonia hongkongensis]